MSPARLLAELTTLEAEELVQKGAVVLLPLGSTEAHGPHLPLGTDVVISEALAARAAAALLGAAPDRPAVIAPTIAYSITHFASEFAGTVSIPAATACSLVRDVCRDLHQQGFTRVCLVSSHLEPAHVSALRQAATEARYLTGIEVAFPDVLEPRWARTLSEEFKRGACHAGSYETSLVLAARPDLVHEELRASLPRRDVNLAKAIKAGVRTFREAGAADAYFGDPAAGSVAEGEALYARLVEMVSTVVRETWG